MRKLLISQILILFFAFAGSAQYSEIGVYGGATNVIGDVGQYGLHIPKGYAFGGFYRYNINEHYALRASVNYGFIQNDDAESSFENRIERNLSFQSQILEASALLEFNFFEFRPGTKKNHTPYIFAGIGIFSFNPKTEFEGNLIELRPLGTEGQGTSASNVGFYPEAASFFAFGGGYKWAIGNFTSIGVEMMVHRSSTDYLDDVSGQYVDPTVLIEERGELAAALADRSLSQFDKTNVFRGNPNTTDWYFFTGITLQVKFGEFYEKCSKFVQ